MNYPTALTHDGCLARVTPLRRALDLQRLDAALIGDRRHVHYLTGYWCPAVFATVALIERNGPMTLVTPHPIDFDSAADRLLQYPAQRLATMIEDHLGSAIDQIGRALQRCESIGIDGPILPWTRPETNWIDLRPVLWEMRRRKAPDELALLKRAINATEAAYAYAAGALRPGVSEIEIFAGIQAAAAESAGEVLGEFGNDFQIGSPGGPPRRRQAEAGEIAVYDLSVTLRGYRSDMCRSFVVGREPTAAQSEAHQRVLSALQYVEEYARPGTSCARLYREVAQHLENPHGWRFPHHLGHGIGLAAHEAPRLNPEWNDTLEAGDVIAVEPGLYGDDLKAGPRIEEIYHVTDSGLEKLTSFPTAMA